MSKVEVLCPNGHRVNIKTTASTRLLQVVEEACAKQGFTPATDYALKHGRKLLDLTLTLRYAGLPNLAKLELVKSDRKRVESNVTIALQLPSGERIQQEYEPTAILWDILLRVDSEREEKLARVTEDGLHPVCVYMREEVIGEAALRNTTLRQLGLTGGRAIIRILHRAVDDVTLEATQKQIESEKRRQASIATSVATIPQAMDTENGSDNNMQNSGIETKQSSDEKTQENKTEKMDVTESIQSRDESKNSQPSGAVDAHGGVQLAPGVTMYRPDAVQLSPEEQRMALELADRFGIFPQQEERERQAQLRAERRAQIQYEREQQMRMRQLMRAQPNTEFKFPESTKGQDLYKNEFSDVDKTDFQPCDREPVLYEVSKSSGEETGTVEDVPENFFDLTEADARVLWADSQRKLREVEQQPLMTNAMREAMRETQMNKYARAIIRVCFPSGQVLQVLFRPRETVHALYQCIAQHLHDPQTDFYLYTTPPKCVLKDKSCTLIQAKLVPMSNVYFGSEKKLEQVLNSATLEKLSTSAEASSVLIKHMQPNCDSKEQQKPEARGEKSGMTSQKSSGSGGEVKTPKWFKIGKR